MRDLEADVTRIALTALAVAALYDVLFLNGGRPAVQLLQTALGGFSGILARVTGQQPPAGY